MSPAPLRRFPRQPAGHDSDPPLLTARPGCRFRSRWRSRSTLLLAAALLVPGAAASQDPEEPPAIEPPLIEAREVTVTSTRSERNLLDVPGNVTLIDREKIEASSAQNVPDLLRGEAGLFVTNDVASPSGFTVEARGFNNGSGTGSSTLVMIDGRRINEQDTSQVDWSWIPLDNIDRIEIVRGPVSAAYGGSALGGVIHIHTQRPETDGTRVVARGRSGGFDTDAGSLLVEGRHGAVGASLFLDDYSTDAYRDQSDYRAKQGELGLDFDLGGRGTLALRGGYTTSTRERPGSLSQEQMDADRRQANPASQGDSSQARQRFIQAQLDLDLAEGLSLRVLPYHRRRTDSSSLTGELFGFGEERETDVYGVDSQIQLDTQILGRSLRAILGGDVRQDDVDVSSLFTFEGFEPSETDGSARRKLWAVFAQAELWLRDDLLLSVGTRRDRARFESDDTISGVSSDVRQTVWSPRAALTWRIIEPVSVYASYSRGFRYPSLSEVFGIFGFASDLVPEKSDSYEVGLKVRTERADLNLAFYTMNVQDEIFFNPEVGLFGSNVNVDRIRHRGIEVSGELRLCEALALFGSYTYDDVKFTRDTLTGLEGNQVPLTPRHRGTAGLRLNLPHGFEASVFANYVGARYAVNDVMEQYRLPRFATYDARIGWGRELHPGLLLELDVTGHNLTNRSYEEVAGVSTTTVPRSLRFFPSARRHYVAGARITWSR
jgi:iron complex outermembrane receptor protein